MSTDKSIALLGITSIVAVLIVGYTEASYFMLKRECLRRGYSEARLTFFAEKHEAKRCGYFENGNLILFPLQEVE